MNEYYSQNGEDAALSRIFGDHVGVCVEVGANDGVTLSNTYYFEKLGWQCILVEPNPALCQKIRLQRGERTALFACAASRSGGTATLNLDANSGDLYSTLEPLNDAAGTESSMQVSVPTRTLDSILEEAGFHSIDFISIDVEGHELHALSGIDLLRWKPRIVLLEDNKDLSDNTVCQHMASAGYLRFYRTGSNDWYARPGEQRIMLALRLLTSRPASWRGFAKVSLPQWLLRPALHVHRKFLSR